MSKASGVELEKLARDTERVMYMNAHQALEYGIVDKVVDKVEKSGLPSEAPVSTLSRGLG